MSMSICRFSITLFNCRLVLPLPLTSMQIVDYNPGNIRANIQAETGIWSYPGHRGRVEEVGGIFRCGVSDWNMPGDIGGSGVAEDKTSLQLLISRKLLKTHKSVLPV